MQSSFDDLTTALSGFTWSMARYRFDMIVTESIGLPPYAGSMIRGAFGNSLRRIACMTHQKTCEGCPLHSTCPYRTIFEPTTTVEHALQKFSHIPGSYIVEAPEWGEKVYQPGETLSFHVILMGKSLEHLALIIFAMQKAFSFHVGHGKAALKGVYHIDKNDQARLIYANDFPAILEHDTKITFESPSTLSEDLLLIFLTPLRLQDNGRALRLEEITSQIFFMTLIRRIGLLLDFHQPSSLALPFSDLKTAASQIELTKNLQWQDWIRYSSRQQQKMHLGGHHGQLQFKDVPPLFRLFLEMGAFFHVGKSTTFGLGKYRLD